MDSLHYLWMKTYLQMKRLVNAQAGALGLSPGQPKILEFLAEYGEHEQKAIAEYCEIEPATAGSILLRMETAGLVVRRNHPDNRRSLYVSLTPEGQRMAQKVCGIFAAVEEQVTAGLTAGERTLLRQLLGKCMQDGKGSLE